MAGRHAGQSLPSVYPGLRPAVNPNGPAPPRCRKLQAIEPPRKDRRLSSGGGEEGSHTATTPALKVPALMGGGVAVRRRIYIVMGPCSTLVVSTVGPSGLLTVR